MHAGSKKVLVAMPAGFLAVLDAKATARFQNRSEVIREAIRVYLNLDGPVTVTVPPSNVVKHTNWNPELTPPPVEAIEPLPPVPVSPIKAVGSSFFTRPLIGQAAAN